MRCSLLAWEIYTEFGGRDSDLVRHAFRSILAFFPPFSCMAQALKSNPFRCMMAGHYYSISNPQDCPQV